MGCHLQAVSPSPASLQIPASIGEVVDKITILELKAARLSGERQINAKLWAIEDDIRALEAKQDFGNAFVALARAVYFTNDERAAVKRAINERHGSAIVEEKLYASYGDGTQASKRLDPVQNG